MKANRANDIMAKVNFTIERVSSFKCDASKQQSILWDAKTPGLGLRATINDSKSYIFETRLHGKTLRLTIGDVRTWTIGKAQVEATRLKTLCDQGVDPRVHMAELRVKAEGARKEAERQDVTVAEAWSAYIAACKPKWSERHYRDHMAAAHRGGQEKPRGKGKTIPGPIASFMSLRLAELDSDAISAWLIKESIQRPTVTALAFRLLRAFINWASSEPKYSGLVAPETHKGRSVRTAVPTSQPKHGDCLQREQLPAWFDAVQKIRNPVISTYLQALLITGARREEMASLRWDDVDFQWRSLTIRDKVEGTRMIPLPPYLLRLLQELKRINETPPPKKIRETDANEWEPSAWVFFSRSAKTGRIQEPRIAHNEALHLAGLPHITLHGLRRSFGTLCEWVEMPSGISAQIMGHKPSAIAEKHYRRRPLDLLRSWHDKIEAWILEQANIHFETELEPPKLRVAYASLLSAKPAFIKL